VTEPAPSSRSINAFHEAGHAVAAYVLRRGITVISIRPDGQHGGIVSVTDLSSGQLKRRERDATIALAGVWAERRHRGGVHGGLSAQEDFRTAREVVRDVAARRGQDPELVVRAQLQAALDQAELLVDQQWPAIELLASEVMRRETLSGRVVRELLRHAVERQRMGTNGH
jgi:ATP-dependent Zn protease